VNKAKVGYFSFTEIQGGGHRAFNEWHTYDHMPEQLALDGMVLGERWVASPACRAARLADDASLSGAQYVILYLVTEPVEQTLDEFYGLAVRLRELGRLHPEPRTHHLASPFRVVEAFAAPRVLVSAEAVPFRPHRGVYVIVEEPSDDERIDDFSRRFHQHGAARMLDVPGVAGIWTFAPFAHHGVPSTRARITLCWLDDDPLDVAEAMRPVLEERWDGAPVRPLLAGPLESIEPGRWDWFD
jgi:hypothetical protein